MHEKELGGEKQIVIMPNGDLVVIDKENSHMFKDMEFVILGVEND